MKLLRVVRRGYCSNIYLFISFIRLEILKCPRQCGASVQEKRRAEYVTHSGDQTNKIAPHAGTEYVLISLVYGKQLSTVRLPYSHQH